MIEATVLYITTHPYEIVIAVILAIFAALVIVLCQKLKSTQNKLRKHYEFVCKKSSTLKPKDLLGDRLFHEYYYERPEDRRISEILNKQENLLIIGPPWSGKSRAAYQALKRLSNPYNISKIECDDINPEDLMLPRHLFSRRPRLLLIDDLHRFVEVRKFEHLFRVARKNKITILAICPSETEYEKVVNKMRSMSLDIYAIFKIENIITMGKVSKNVGREVARETGRLWEEKFFKGLIGSIFQQLTEKTKEFIVSTPPEKRILGAIKILYYVGACTGRDVFPIKWIKALLAKKGLEFSEEEWVGYFNRLEDKELIKLTGGRVEVENVHIEEVFAPLEYESELVIFQEILPVFANIPDALVRIGNRAWAEGNIKPETVAFMKTAIEAFREALNIYTLEASPANYAMTQNNLGITYITLAEVEGKAENCRKSIEAFSEAEKVYAAEALPAEHAMILNNMGNTYSSLAEVEDKAENCHKAIGAFRKALDIYTQEEMLMDYAMTQNNLGATYKTLADVENKVENCQRAINIFGEALKIYTLKEFAVQYAMTQDNLGAAFVTLADVEEKAENCRRSIEAYGETLKVYTIDSFAYQYAQTQHNMGNAYKTLAEVEDKAENCGRAIDAFGEALKVFTGRKLPEEYQQVLTDMKKTVELYSDTK